MKRFLITTLFLLTVTLLFCQENYPQKLLIESDTVVAVTPDQVRIINTVFDQRDFYKSKSDSLALNISIQSMSLDKQILLNRQLANENNLILMNLDVYSELNKLNLSIIEYKDKELKQQKNKGLKLAIGGFAVGVTTGTLLVLILSK